MKPSLVLALGKRPYVGTLIMAAVVSGFLAVSTRGLWLSPENMEVILRVTAILALVAMGEALVVTAGEIDLSVGSVFVTGALLFMGLAPSAGVAVGLLAALAGGLIIGALNGFLAGYLRIPSLIVTLGTLFIFRGLAYAVTYGFAFSAPRGMTQTFLYQALGGGKVFGVNTAVVWVVLASVIAHALMFHFPVGNRLMAVGYDVNSAYSRGVDVKGIKLGVYLASGFLAALAGVLEAANMRYVDGSFGELLELQAIAAVVLGGCNLRGGRSSFVGTLVAAFVLSGIESYLVIKGIQPQWYVLLLGAIIVMASLMDRSVTRWVVRLQRTAG